MSLIGCVGKRLWAARVVGADVHTDGHPSIAMIGLDGERLGWSGWEQQRAKGTKQQQGRRSIVNTQPSVDTKPTRIAHRPPRWPIQTVQRAYPSVRTATCSEVEEAVSQHDHRRDEGRLMIRGSQPEHGDREDVW